jgi:hypothetical protein
MVWVRREVTQVNMSHNFNEGFQIGTMESDAVESGYGISTALISFGQFRRK